MTVMTRTEQPSVRRPLPLPPATVGRGGKPGWMGGLVVFLGFGFLTKQLQVLLVVPGFALAFMVAGPGTIVRRLRGLLMAGAAILVSAVTGEGIPALIERLVAALVPDPPRPGDPVPFTPATCERWGA